MNHPVPFAHLFLWLVTLFAFSGELCAEQPDGAPGASSSTAQVLERALGSQGHKVVFEGKVLSITLGEDGRKEKQFWLPRLCAPVREIAWEQASEVKLDLTPQPDRWLISWKQDSSLPPVVTIRFDAVPKTIADLGVTGPSADGSVMLHAFQARTVGERLRYEPQPHKNTVGYWTDPQDYAFWDLRISQPGVYVVAVLQGCGSGQGGSAVTLALRAGDRTVSHLDFKTVDTGHFQNFRWLQAGQITVEKPGNFELRLAARSIARKAVCDVRMIHLIKQAD